MGECQSTRPGALRARWILLESLCKPAACNGFSQNPSLQALLIAEREGFEPSVRLLGQRFSRPPRSTAPASLLNRISCMKIATACRQRRRNLARFDKIPPNYARRKKIARLKIQHDGHTLRRNPHQQHTRPPHLTWADDLGRRKRNVRTSPGRALVRRQRPAVLPGRNHRLQRRPENTPPAG